MEEPPFCPPTKYRPLPFPIRRTTIAQDEKGKDLIYYTSDHLQQSLITEYEKQIESDQPRSKV